VQNVIALEVSFQS